MELETCRVCLLNRNCNIIISLYELIAVEELKTEFQISEIIEYCCDVLVKPDDNKPQYICKVCLEDAKTSFQFKQTCTDSDKNLNTFLQNKQVVLLEEILPEHDTQEALDEKITQCIDDKNNVVDEIPENSKEEAHEEGSNEDENKYNAIKMDLVDNLEKVETEDEIIEVVVEAADSNDIVEENQEYEVQQNTVESSEDLKEEENLHCEMEKCSFTARTNLDLKYHMIRHKAIDHINGSNNCPDCVQYYSYKEPLIKHWIKSHSSELYTCKRCDFYTDTKESLQAHKKKEHGYTEVKCSQCSKVFVSLGQLKKHLTIHEKNDTGFYSCEICGTQCKTSYSLHMHRNVHLGIKEYQCQLCFRSFTHQGSLHIHHKVHHSGRDYVCEICGASFTLKYRLRDHLRSHGTERSFKCSDCPKAFKTPAVLRKHVRIIHKGIKNVICPVCEKNFGSKYNLKVHMRVHTKIREHACDQCEKSFTSRSAFIGHLSNH